MIDVRNEDVEVEAAPEVVEDGDAEAEE